MRGRLILKIAQSDNFITTVILIYKSGYLFDPRNFHPRNFHFLVSFSLETIFPLSPSVPTLISKDAEFPCASFDTCEKFATSCPLSKRPRKNSKVIFRRSAPGK